MYRSGYDCLPDYHLVMVLATATGPMLLRANIDVTTTGRCQAQRAGAGEGRSSCIGIDVVAGGAAAAAAAACVHVACSNSVFLVEGVAVEILAAPDNTGEYDEEGDGGRAGYPDWLGYWRISVSGGMFG